MESVIIEGKQTEELQDSLGYYDEEVQKMIEASLQYLSWSSFKAIDIEVSTKCKYLFETKNNSNEEDSELLSNELTRKKQDYFKVIQVIIKYRDEWVKELQDHIYIEQDNISGLEEKIKEKLNMPVNLNEFVQKQLTIIFEAINHENDFIIESEKEIAKVVADKMIEKFEARLNFKIMSGFYNQDQFENYYEELVKHSINSLEKNFDYKSNENSFLIQCKNELNVKLMDQKFVIYSNYSQNMTSTQTSIENYRDRERTFIHKQLNEKYPGRYYENKREIEIFSEELKLHSIVSIEENMEKIRTDLNEDLFNYIIEENIKFIMDQIQKALGNYSFREKSINPTTINNIQNQGMIHQVQTSNESSGKDNLGETGSIRTLFINFGKFYLDSVFIKHGVNEIIDINSNVITNRPNSIWITDRILVGQEAKNIAPGNFDVKNLLRIRNLDVQQKTKLFEEHPFEFNYNNQVKYKKNQDLNIESLIALQVLDIKSETEKRVNTNVTNAVFIVPTNYANKQFEDFRNIGMLSGFEESKVNIITQINCMAINFVDKFQFNGRISVENVLIVSLNEYECDSAVCQINDYNINYKSFLSANLKLNYGEWIFGRLYRFLTMASDPKFTIIGNFQALIGECVRLAGTSKNLIDVILLNISPIHSELSNYIVKNFRCKVINVFNNDVLQGAFYFQKSILDNKPDKLYKIKELNKIIHVKCQLINPRFNISQEKNLFKKNLGEFYLRDLWFHNSQLPTEILLIHDDFLIGRYNIINNFETLDPGDYELHINVFIKDNEQKIVLKCSIRDESGQYFYQMNVKEILYLDELEIVKQKRIIKSKLDNKNM